MKHLASKSVAVGCLLFFTDGHADRSILCHVLNSQARESFTRIYGQSFRHACKVNLADSLCARDACKLQNCYETLQVLNIKNWDPANGLFLLVWFQFLVYCLSCQTAKKYRVVVITSDLVSSPYLR